MCDVGNHFRLREVGVAVVHAINIAQYHQCLALHHGGNQSGKFIIVGKHEFGNRNGIVFVHNRNHPVSQHGVHAMALIEVVVASGKTLFHGEHLPASEGAVAEKIVVAINEAHLPHCRKEHPFAHRI